MPTGYDAKFYGDIGRIEKSMHGIDESLAKIAELLAEFVAAAKEEIGAD